MMLNPKEMIGKLIKTDAGVLKIKTAKYCGMTTNRDRDLSKKVEVKAECGAEFITDIKTLNSVLAT